MSKRNNFVFNILHVVAWIIFIGLCVEAGALIVNFFFSIFKPEYVQKLYQKLDLSQIYNSSQLIFFGLYGFIIAIALLKAYMFYVVILLISKLDLLKPFTSHSAFHIMNISYITLSIGIISYIARQISQNMIHHGVEIEALNRFWADSQAYILMSAVIYVIATIFSRGVELQNENDLTV